MQVQQRSGEPHHGQRRQVFMQLATDLGHFRPAVSDALNVRPSLLQLSDQICPVQIAARLADREENRKWFFYFIHGGIYVGQVLRT